MNVLFLPHVFWISRFSKSLLSEVGSFLRQPLFWCLPPTPPKGKGAVEGIENMDIIWLEEKESLLLQHHIHLTFTI